MTSDRKFGMWFGLGRKPQGPLRGPQKRTRKRKLEGAKLLYVLALRGQTNKLLILLDRIKRDKGVWWMPRQQEAMKDVIICDKLGGADNRL